MELDIGTAIIAGLAGTAVMTLLMSMGGMMNMKMDMPMMLGTMVLPRGQAAFILGLMIHFMMGAVFFIAYAILFEVLGVESGVVGVAALFGVVHGVMAGAAMGMMPAMHPRMAPAGAMADATGVAAPGAFATSFGLMGPMAIILVHAALGAVGGLIYG